MVRRDGEIRINLAEQGEFAERIARFQRGEIDGALLFIFAENFHAPPQNHKERPPRVAARQDRFIRRKGAQFRMLVQAAQFRHRQFFQQRHFFEQANHVRRVFLRLAQRGVEECFAFRLKRVERGQRFVIIG